MVIINLNVKKNIYVSQKIIKEGVEVKLEKANLPFRILKYLSNPFLNLIIIFSYFLTYNLSQLIIVISLNFNCSLIEATVSYLYITLTVIIIISILIITIYDIFVNRRLIFSIKCYELFLKKDPLYFRMELYFIGFFMIICFLTIIIFDRVFPFNRIYYMLTQLLLLFLLFFYQTLFILLITIFQTIRSYIYGSNLKTDEIVELLNDEIGHQIFLSFTQSEFSTENISCYDDIQLFNKETTQAKRKEISNLIYSTYLNGLNSKLEVCIFFLNFR